MEAISRKTKDKIDSGTCVSHAPGLGRIVAKFAADPVTLHDPELAVPERRGLAFCGQADAAVSLLTKAIKGNHWSYPAMDKDPLFDPSACARSLWNCTAAIQCQQRFLIHRAQVDAALEAAQ